MRFKKRVPKSRPDTYRKFAWWPKRLDNGETVWLEFYTAERRDKHPEQYDPWFDNWQERVAQLEKDKTDA